MKNWFQNNNDEAEKYTVDTWWMMNALWVNHNSIGGFIERRERGDGGRGGAQKSAFLTHYVNGLYSD